MLEQYPTLSPEDRDQLIEQMVTPETEGLAAGRRLQELDLDYSSSGLTLSSGDTTLDGPLPGTRAPDATDLVIGGTGTSLFKLPAEDQYRLFLLCGDAHGPVVNEIKAVLAATARHTAWLTTYVVVKEATSDPFEGHSLIEDPKAHMHDAYGATHPCIYLIRPDGYVAYRSEDIASVDRYFDHLGPIRKR